MRPYPLIIGLLITVSGCVSVDTKALNASPSPDSSTAIVGIFNNVAFYRAGGEFVASPTLSEALEIGLRGLTSVKVTRPSDTELELDFREYGKTVYIRRYVNGSGLSITADGRYVIAIPGRCGGRDSPGFGCGYKTVTLFVESRGYLAAVESGGGAGVVGIVPLAVYAKHIALFAREE